MASENDVRKILWNLDLCYELLQKCAEMYDDDNYYDPFVLSDRELEKVFKIMKSVKALNEDIGMGYL